MPKFDMKDREGQPTLGCHYDGQEYYFTKWPYSTEDPIELFLLRKYYNTFEIPPKAPAEKHVVFTDKDKEFVFVPEAKPLKPKPDSKPDPERKGV